MKRSLYSTILQKMLKPRKGKPSYSQSGEDMICSFALRAMGIKEPYYLDIGAHHPFHLSNTAFFYENGCSGITVEPDPDLFENIKKHRPRDTCLNVGISVEEDGSSDFYIMTASTLNTFSKQEAERYVAEEGQTIKSVKSLPLLSVDTLIEQHCQRTPDFVSLDVEGLDYEILSKFNFEEFRPAVLCVETSIFSNTGKISKSKKFASLMNKVDYFPYADTCTNTIFVDKNRWESK